MKIKSICRVVALGTLIFAMSVGLSGCGTEVADNEGKERKTTEASTEEETTTEATTQEVTTEATTEEVTTEEASVASQTDSVSYQDYLAKSFTFSEDGLSGDFTIDTFDEYEADFVTSLQVGDKLADGTDVESLEVEDDKSIVWINSEGGYSVTYFEIQENGKYYFRDDAGFAATTSVGEKTFPISKDVVIVDNFAPFGKNGIKYNEDEVKVYKNIDELKAQLDDPNAWYTPELFIRVENGEITFIAVNPWQHEPWGDF